MNDRASSFKFENFIANTGDYETILGLNETILGLNTIGELKIVCYLKVYCYLIE